jgi:hypothetical protein
LWAFDAGSWSRLVGLEPSVAPPDGDHAGLFDARTVPWLVPTRTAIFRVDPATGVAVEALSHPWFHDLHAAWALEGGVLAVATGWEGVLDVTWDGRVRRTWTFGVRGPPVGDGRRLAHDCFKPHQFHPNAAFILGNGLWVTGLSARAVVGPSGHRIDLPGLAHDGVPRDGLWWFTTVEGRVLALDLPGGTLVVDIHAARAEGYSGHPGWCRGVEVVGDQIWLGFSQERGSRWRETARAMLRGPKAPSRVVQIDRKSGRYVGSWPFPDPTAAIYGLAWSGG